MKNTYFAYLSIFVFLLSCNNDTDALDEVSVEKPSAPINLEAVAITSNSVSFSWTNTEEVKTITGYKVFQDGNEIAQTTETSYLVTGLSAGTTFSFSISVLDAQGNESKQSAENSVTTENISERGKVLVFTKTAGFNHRTESESAAMVQLIADNQNFDVITDNDGSEFDTLSNLNQYDIIYFSNTSGDFLSASQRANVEAYAAQGGNFISNHAASDAYGHSTADSVSGNGKGVWDWYAENVTGCSVRNGPNHTANNFGATVTVQNANTELTTGINFPWNDNEEWYYWEGGYLNSSFSELLRVSDTGPDSYDDARMTAQLWERPDGGISFYTSMGHSKNKYSDADFVKLMDNVFNFILD